MEILALEGWNALVLRFAKSLFLFSSSTLFFPLYRKMFSLKNNNDYEVTSWENDRLKRVYRWTTISIDKSQSSSRC